MLICSHDCPHCGHHNIFLGWTQMLAYVCENCGNGVDIRPVEQ
jgi:uncharacterized protein (DUF983 family)